MTYESVTKILSKVAPGVAFTVTRMSFGRRMELMRRIRELAGRMEFLRAGSDPKEQMDAGLVQAEIDRTYVSWGLRSVEGIELDGEPATPEALAERGPEDLFREVLQAVKAETGITEAERKN
jgi:hypothetical protein